MKALSVFIVVLGAALLLFGCESLGQLGEAVTSVGVATGHLSSGQASSINKSVQAVGKTFEDITPEQEYYIGRAVAAVIFSTYPPYQSAKANDYVNLLGQSLALASERPETYGGYHFQILDSDQINAFAAPGGLILVTRGLLRCAENEDEAAAILAHEIGHVVKEHGLQAIKTSRLTTALTSVALTAAETAGPEELSELTSVFGDSIGDITSTLVNSGYSRTLESEADHQAVAILRQAGYDPAALVKMLQVMEKKLSPGGLDFAKTHPDPKDRIADVQSVLSEAAPAAAAPAQRQTRYKTALGGI
jgi:predicted Zn-dependent protease